MKRKLVLLLASCSLAALILLPVGTNEAGAGSTQMLIKPLVHGAGD